MNKIHFRKGNVMASGMVANDERVRDWQHWAPYAAVAWSLIYAALGLYWAMSGRGFPYTPGLISDVTTGPVVGRFGTGVAWIIVVAAGFPAAIMGLVMQRGVKRFRPLLITAGAMLGLILLLAMIEFSLMIEIAYVPYVAFNLIIGSEFGRTFVDGMLQSRWTIIYQLLCLIGGFLWLAATVVYARRSGDACLYCESLVIFQARSNLAGIVDPGFRASRRFLTSEVIITGG